MAKYKYVVKNVPTDSEAMSKFIIEDLGPLLEDYWNTYGEKLYGRPINFDMEAFVRAWIGQAAFLLMAYDEDDDAVGFMVGMKFRPIFYESRILQIERWYSVIDDVVDGMFSYLDSITDILGVQEVYITDFKDGTRVPQKFGGSQVTEFLIKRYVR